MNWLLLVLGFGGLAGLVGGEAADRDSEQGLIGDERKDVSDPTKGPDLFNGTTNATLIDADSGNDTVDGHQGSDNPKGGA